MNLDDALTWLKIKYPGMRAESLVEDDLICVFNGEMPHLVLRVQDVPEIKKIVDRLSTMANNQLERLASYVHDQAPELSYEELMCGLLAIDEVNRRVAVNQS